MRKTTNLDDISIFVAAAEAGTFRISQGGYDASRLSHCVVMLDKRETKEDHLDPCIAQVTAIREVADASPLPRRGPHSPFIYLRPSHAIHKCVPHRAGTDLSKATVAELFGQAPRPVEPKAVSAKVRAAHHAFLARRGLNAVQADS